MANEGSKNLVRRLREAAAKELLGLVTTHVEALDVGALRQLFRNPHLNLPVIEVLLTQRRLLVFQEVRRELARHPYTPEVRALQFVAGLFWRDLLDITGEARVRPRVRRAAERQLLGRLLGLGTGERITIARRASPLLVAQLRHDSEPRVIAALLENPRLTEGALIPLASSETAKPESLLLLARHKKWGSRYALRLTLCRNRRTPAQTAIGMLPHLKKQDLMGIERDRRLHAAVRRRAGVLLGRTPP